MTDLDETWLNELTQLPPDRQVAPGLTVADLASFHARPPTPSSCVLESNVVYTTIGRTGRPLQLDVYRHIDAGAPRPGVLFIHGGSWSEGHRYAHIKRACVLAAKGWVGATMSYRLAPGAKWPSPLLDVRSALAWMRSRATWLGLDPDRLVVAGNSAGGHLAAMAVLTEEPHPAQTVSHPVGQRQRSPLVAAAGLWYPITDLAAVPALQHEVKALLGRRWRKLLGPASPLNYVSAGAPPIITFHGAADEIVPVSSAVRFHQALDAAQVHNELHVYPGAGHAFDFHPRLWTETLTKFEDFLRPVVGSPS